MNASADTVVSQANLFGGSSLNIYSPTVIRDNRLRNYGMWYSGWQTAGQQVDSINYRSSNDLRTWSSYSTVLTTAKVPNASLVGEPSVTQHYNAATGAYQYTMFYTVCMSPCNGANGGLGYNEIWSSVSNDGVNWLYPQLLLRGASEPGGVGPAQPSAILDPEADGTFWKVYYRETNTNSIGANNGFKVAHVNGNRIATKANPVYVHTGDGTIANPEVRLVNGTWQLFFDVYRMAPLQEVDIYKVESSVNTSWPSNADEVLITNGGPTWCGTITPGVLAGSGSQYNLFFGLAQRWSDGGCYAGGSDALDINRDIEGWLWNDNVRHCRFLKRDSCRSQIQAPERFDHGVREGRMPTSLSTTASKIRPAAEAMAVRTAGLGLARRESVCRKPASVRARRSCCSGSQGQRTPPRALSRRWGSGGAIGSRPRAPGAATRRRRTRRRERGMH